MRFLVLTTTLLVPITRRFLPPTMFLPLVSREARFVYANNQTVIRQQARNYLCNHESLCIIPRVVVVDYLGVVLRLTQHQLLAKYLTYDVHGRNSRKAVTTHLTSQLLECKIDLPKLIESSFDCINDDRVTSHRNHSVNKNLLLTKPYDLTGLDANYHSNLFQRKLVSAWPVNVNRI